MADEKPKSPIGTPTGVAPGSAPTPGVPDPATQKPQQPGSVTPDSKIAADKAGNETQNAQQATADEQGKKDQEKKPSGPAIHTDSKTDFNKRKIAELERQALEAENLQGQRRLAAVSQIRAQIRELREREAKTYGGANIQTPRGSLLQAEEAISKRPDMHYRYVNINAPGRADNVRAMGYEKVPEDEGGKTLGDLALFRIPLERHAQVVGARDRKTKADLQKVTEDLKGEVKSMAKFLQTKGVDVDPERLGVFSNNPED